MKSVAVSLILLILTVATISYLVLIIKNKNLSMNKKLLWTILIIFLPIIGGTIYLAKKGESNA